MSWLFSQALVEEYSEGISLDGAQSAQSSGKPTQQAYCAPDKMTAFSRLSRFGMTYKPLTATHGEALLMSYLAAFHAKICPPPNGGGAGRDGERSGMWREMARVVGEVRPRYVFVENSPMLVNRGLDRVLGDLSQMGFDAKWGIMGADFIGAPHRRERIWIFAYPHGFRPIQREHKRDRISKQEDHSDKSNNGNRVWGEADRLLSLDQWSKFTSRLCGMDDGLASRVDRVKACGNGQVPEVAATAWRLLNE